MRSTSCDVAVIGSGFGGSVCALRAAEAGRDVVLLERGPAISPDYFDALAAGKRPLICTKDQPGILNIHRMHGLTALTGNAVGGGSHVYTAVTVPAPREVFDGNWPSEFNCEMMAPFYEMVRNVIRPTPIPKALPRTAALGSAAQLLNREAPLLPVAIDWPTDFAKIEQAPERNDWRAELAIWLRGGHATTKRTLDKTYLSAAQSAGARVFSRHEVQFITPASGGYWLHFRKYQNETWITGTLFAQRIVIAAGTINTLRILFNCRDNLRTLPGLSGALGEKFFTNGDFGAALLGHSIPRDSGPPVTSWVDCWSTDRLYLMEIGLLPSLPWLVGKAVEYYSGMRGLAGRGEVKPWIFGVMGFDSTPLRISMDQRGQLRCDGAAQRSPFHDRTLALLHDLADALSAKLIMPPSGILPPGQITVHPLGGARIAESPEHGVVNSFGEVFGYPGLFVADGSILPCPTGAAPSMTIAALAERVSQAVVAI